MLVFQGGERSLSTPGFFFFLSLLSRLVAPTQTHPTDLVKLGWAGPPTMAPKIGGPPIRWFGRPFWGPINFEPQPKRDNKNHFLSFSFMQGGFLRTEKMKMIEVQTIFLFKCHEIWGSSKNSWEQKPNDHRVGRARKMTYFMVNARPTRKISLLDKPLYIYIYCPPGKKPEISCEFCFFENQGVD